MKTTTAGLTVAILNLPLAVAIGQTSDSALSAFSPALWQKTGCEQSLRDTGEKRAYPLDDTHSLLIAECWRAAYNFGYALFVINRRNSSDVRPLQLQDWNDKAKKFQNSANITSASFATTKTLTSFHKGRGVGDCGQKGEWKWRGENFQLTRFWIKDDCDGQPFLADKRWQVFPK
jgi:Trk-type K+ transport system membrane component